MTSFTPRRLCCAALLLSALWWPVAAGAQELPAEPPVAPRPLELLLEHRQQLGLTEPQLERIGRIRARLARANEPLVQRMLTLRQQWQQHRSIASPDQARLRRIRAAAQPVHARIQVNNRTAMQAVNRLLTREQRQRLRAIVEERRQVAVPEPAPPAETHAAEN